MESEWRGNVYVLIGNLFKMENSWRMHSFSWRGVWPSTLTGDDANAILYYIHVCLGPLLELSTTNHCVDRSIHIKADFLNDNYLWTYGKLVFLLDLKNTNIETYPTCAFTWKFQLWMLERSSTEYLYLESSFQYQSKCENHHSNGLKSTFVEHFIARTLFYHLNVKYHHFIISAK